MLCLSCFHLWPSGSLYCGHCGRSFGGRRCARGHQSPAAAARCVLCGDRRLTQATAFVPLGWLYRGLAWLAVLFLLRWAFFHRPTVGQGLADIARWTLSNVVRVEPHILSAWASQIATLLVLAVLGLAALPGRFSHRLRVVAVGFGRIFLMTLGHAILAIGRWLWHVAGTGRPRA